MAKSNKTSTHPKCRCREPKCSSRCMYCGSMYVGEWVCGQCHEAGIDGKVIPGTARVVCEQHKAKAKKETRK